MSQRDQFAMRAMAAIIGYPDSENHCSIDKHAELVAFAAYQYADAMLKERERTNKSKAQKELEK